MTERLTLQRSTNRAGFDLGTKRYGHHQQPAVLAANDATHKATIMAPEQFDGYLDAIRDELTRQGKPLHNPDMPACQEKKAREAAAQ